MRWILELEKDYINSGTEEGWDEFINLRRERWILELEKDEINYGTGGGRN